MMPFSGICQRNDFDGRYNIPKIKVKVKNKDNQVKLKQNKSPFIMIIQVIRKSTFIMSRLNQTKPKVNRLFL